MIRLNDRLKVTEKQKTEITNMLFAYMKRISQEKDLTNISATTITTWWIQQVKKPRWLQEKINEDAEFIGQICSFVESYKDTICFQPVDEYPLRIKETPSISMKLMLKGLAATKGVVVNISTMTESEIMQQIDKLFYPNNQSDTLGEFPLQ